MKAIYTYWAPNKSQESCGFNNTKDLAYILALSVEYSKKHFGRAELVTNNAGKALLVDKLKIGFTSVDTSLEGFDCHPDLWAMAKIKAYSLQTEPFISIDLDCVLYQKPSRELMKSALFFQHKEDFKMQPGYKHLVKAIETTTVSYYCKNQKVDYAYNCGIVGVNDLALVKKWYAMAEDFINNKGNQLLWNSLQNKGQMNYVYEQYFIACLVKEAKLKRRVGFVLENFDFKNIARPKFKMLHVWGGNKKNLEQMDKVRARLKKDFPKAYSKVSKTKTDWENIYADIMFRGSKKYTALLKRTIESKAIKSIVYLGFDEKESKFISQTQNKNFLYHTAIKNSFPKCDLLIIKDLFPLWSGEEYADFIKGLKGVKYIMDAGKVYKLKK